MYAMCAWTKTAKALDLVCQTAFIRGTKTEEIKIRPIKPM